MPMTKFGTTTENVFQYAKDHPGESLQEIADALKLASRSNVLYHLRKLAAVGKVGLPVDGKHRQFRVIQEN
jgi:predicted transcriptional regulator